MTNLSPVTAETLAGFINGAQDAINAYYAANFTKSVPPVLEAMEGQKFFRIVRVGPGERSAFCFIDKATGNILKCAGWKAPAKHARGNINTPTFGAEFVGPYGPAYMR